MLGWRLLCVLVPACVDDVEVSDVEGLDRGERQNHDCYWFVVLWWER